MNRREYFDEVAEKWDGWNREEELRPRLCAQLDAFGIEAGDRVVDLGCGTGVLIGPVLERLGPDGEVVAVDFAPRMLEAAAARAGDRRVRLECAEAEALPCGAGTVDQVICFSTWPHFPDAAAVLREQLRVLRPGGRLHVLHLKGRDAINEIHHGAGGAIGHDMLVPAVELAEAARACGFEVVTAIDEPELYRVELRRPG